MRTAPRGILAAVRAGVDSIEHGTFIDDAGIARDEGARDLFLGDADGVQRAATMYIGKGIFSPQ